jgi:hypothetical protein
MLGSTQNYRTSLRRMDILLLILGTENSVSEFFLIIENKSLFFSTKPAIIKGKNVKRYFQRKIASLQFSIEPKYFCRTTK